MNYRMLLALDPSGNFKEGKGTTGWCIFNCADMRVAKTGYISALKYDNAEDYWGAHLALIDKYASKYKKGTFGLVIEDYLLYATRAASQVNSRMETPKVIGLMQYHCYKNKIPYYLEPASEVKNRWTNEILKHSGYIKEKSGHYYAPRLKQELNRHCLDAVRHAVHYATFKNGVKRNVKN